MKKIEKAVQTGIQKIKDQNLFIGEVTIKTNDNFDASGRFYRARDLKEHPSGRSISLKASIHLHYRWGREENVVVHEYGHFVDWVLGGSYKGTDSANPICYWSNQNFPSIFDPKNQRELFAEAFTHYCYKSSLQGFFIPLLNGGQGEFKKQLEAKFRSLQSSNI